MITYMINIFVHVVKIASKQIRQIGMTLPKVI